MHRGKGLLVWTIIILSAALSVGTTSAGEQRETIQTPVQFLQPEWIQTDGRLLVEVPGCEQSANTYLCPRLPYLTSSFKLPLQADDVRVELDDAVIEEMTLEAPLELSDAPIPLADPALFTPTPSPLFDEAAWFPERRVSVSVRCGRDVSDWQLKKFVSVAIFPMTYLASEGRAKFLSSASLNLSYTLSESRGGAEPGEDTCDLLIIAPEEFSRDLDGLVFHKSLLGIRTSLVTLEEVLDLNDGRDDAERVKRFIADHVTEHGTRYVLGVGDSNKFPVRHAEVWDGYDDYANTTDGHYVPSELYYSDLFDADGEFSSWDTNDDGVFGEANSRNPEVDKVDLMPDVFFARLPVETEEEFATVISQIIDYELNTEAGRGGWNDVVLCGSLIFGPGPEGEGACEQLASGAFSGYNSKKLYATTTYARDAVATPDTVIEYVNRGCRFLTNVGHGLYYAWYFGMNQMFLSADVLRLNNQETLPVVSAASCETGGFDNEIWEHPQFPTDDCIGEHFVLHRGAAIGYAGATRVAFGDGDANTWNNSFLARMNREFFAAHKNGHRRCGDMMIKAAEEYITSLYWASVYDVKTVMEYALFGDPSLEVGGQLSQILLPLHVGLEVPKTAVPGQRVRLLVSCTNHTAESCEALVVVAMCSPQGELVFYPNWTSDMSMLPVTLEAGFSVDGLELTAIDSSIHCSQGYNSLYIALLSPNTLELISNLGGGCIHVM